MVEIRFNLAHDDDARVSPADAMLLVSARSAEDGGDLYLAELERVLEAMFGDLASLNRLDPADLKELVNRLSRLLNALVHVAYFLRPATQQLQEIEPEDAVPLQTILLLVEQHLEALAALGGEPA